MAALTQTMTGQSPAPVAGLNNPAPGSPEGEMSMADLKAQLGTAYDDLEKRISAIPGVDYQKMMQPLLDTAKNKQIENKPPWWASALGALGNSGQTPTIDVKLHEIQQHQDAKDAQIAHIQEAITSGAIDQEMQKGNFKKAMEQSRTLQMLKPILDKYDRQIALKDFQAKETVKQQGRIALAKERGTQARASLVERAKILTKGMSIDERILLAQVNHIARSQEIALQRAATYDPLAQEWKVNETDMTTIQEDGNTQLEQWIAAHKTTAPAPSSMAPAPAPGGKPQSAQDRIRAAAGR